jgi:hypothetical protein
MEKIFETNPFVFMDVVAFLTLFLLALPAIENQNLIKYHGSKKM